MRTLALALALASVTAGCHQAQPPVTAKKPLVPLTFFAADNDDYPDVVRAVNERLQGTFPRGATIAYAAVTLEEAALAVGCASAGTDCWNLIADPVPTSALLVAEVKKEAGTGVRIHLLIYDAAGGNTLREAERAYVSSSAAVAAVPEVVDLLVRGER